MNKTMYFVRHAQSQPASNLPTAQWPLSTKGMNQARLLVDVLKTLDIEQVFSSPYLRCLQTIGPFSQHAGLPVEQRDGLHEVEIVRELRSDFSEVWERAWRDFDYSLPNCESHGQAQRRFLDAVESVLHESLGNTIAICAHGAVIGLLLHAIEPGSGREQSDALTNPDVLRILVDDKTWTWDRSFQLPGLSDIVSHHAETPIDWE